ncbi:MAG: hypothetical protein RMJ19_02295 [Gemmatales bacterium]|nr:hypothetical protein [Gemmatales bacterium]MCS7159278.1 hypothetical protein [Gemmatales bacterium]MDW8174478.1 hypothetical protein [Gemmatales bacterium]MDW8222389.1 hypothetical protein [Gemmatales bacterium]
MRSGLGISIAGLLSVLILGNGHAQEILSPSGRYFVRISTIPSISHYYPAGAVFLPYVPPVQPNFSQVELYYPSAWRYYPNIRFATDYYWYPYPYPNYSVHMPGYWFGPGGLPPEGEAPLTLPAPRTLELPPPRPGP